MCPFGVLSVGLVINDRRMGILLPLFAGSKIFEAPKHAHSSRLVTQYLTESVRKIYNIPAKIVDSTDVS